MKLFILKIQNLLNVLIVENNFLVINIFKHIKKNFNVILKISLIVKYAKKLLDIDHYLNYMKKFILKIQNLLNVMIVENNILVIKVF